MDGASDVSRGFSGPDTRNGAFRTPLDKACLTPKPVLL